MGRKLTLTGVTISDAQAPKLITVDPIESAGSLLLLDPTHPTQQWASGVPNNGDSLPNLAPGKGQTIVGAQVTVMVLRQSGYDGTKGRIERSAKGGVHGVVSPTLADGTTQWIIQFDAATREFFRTTNHALFVSVWGRQTKASTPIGGARPGFRAGVYGDTGPASNNLFTLDDSNYSRRSAVSTAVGPQIINLTKQGWSGTAPGSASNVSGGIFVPPCSAFNYLDTLRRAQGGYILYRCYLEDLTVSGRTYAEVDAIDSALYTTEVLTPGGRYYGDTYTDPTTLA